MPDSKWQGPAVPPGQHLLLFDGVCGLCSHLVQFVLAHDRGRVFRFGSLQSVAGRAAVGASGGNPDDLTTLYVVENYQSARARVLTKGRGALFVCRALGWPWKAAGALSALPAAWLDGLYDFVARHRYRVFGRRDVCLVPRREDRSRFIDSEIDPPPGGRLAP